MNIIRKTITLIAIGLICIPTSAQIDKSYREIMDIFTNEIKEKYYNFNNWCNFNCACSNCIFNVYMEYCF